MQARCESCTTNIEIVSERTKFCDACGLPISADLLRSASEADTQASIKENNGHIRSTAVLSIVLILFVGMPLWQFSAITASLQAWALFVLLVAVILFLGIWAVRDITRFLRENRRLRSELKTPGSS